MVDIDCSYNNEETDSNCNALNVSKHISNEKVKDLIIDIILFYHDIRRLSH